MALQKSRYSERANNHAIGDNEQKLNIGLRKSRKNSNILFQKPLSWEKKYTSGQWLSDQKAEKH